MRVLVLGGTGAIGGAIVRNLIAAGHAVSGLARSPEAAERLMEIGAEPIAGDIGNPRLWAGAVVGDLDAVVHAACSFTDAMGPLDSSLLDTLLPALAGTSRRPSLIYTGGCWLWGPSPDKTIDEETTLDPLPAFAWMVPNLRRVLAEPGIRGAVVHPAMVHAERTGPLAAMAERVRKGQPVQVVGSPDVMWPLVHADDLAELYRLVLEDAAFTGQVIGVADNGVPVGTLARLMAGGETAIELVPEDHAARERGDWARGFARSQRMSGALARDRFGWTPARCLDPGMPDLDSAAKRS
ncbi:NAD-dependent epimerase/dehydratase [alpha proteobacterium BAL199]|jgi:nucleoside-diphosphate-sugar epimerase|nr:NAD-dependent epimerase/dehydratase [alpha proteobacterium BAL199]